ncbi:hypothetical protein HGM15179_009324 [Zosterops borbonicus]|uniref:Uncharacterized protein n=1 Tax=Zosterops borbonicus TaxID=364589 RepID=A0A8K1GFF1_9PASS|nr:hypothetical protein HGM15179_009324 [Zosterops borbonicus]
MRPPGNGPHARVPRAAEAAQRPSLWQNRPEKAISTDVSQNEIIYANAVFFSHVANEPVERDPCWASFDEAVRPFPGHEVGHWTLDRQPSREPILKNQG